jgi:hypothetical protein
MGATGLRTPSTRDQGTLAPAFNPVSSKPSLCFVSHSFQKTLDFMIHLQSIICFLILFFFFLVLGIKLTPSLYH